MSRVLTYERTRGPILRRETIKVVRLVSLDGVGPETHPLRFEREVLTIRDTETTARTVTAGDRTINEGTTHNDFYGFLSSPRHVLTGAREYAESAEFGIGDKVRREVVLKVIERRFLPTNRPDERLGGPEYLVPPSDWLIDDEAFPPFLAERLKPWADKSFDVQPNAVAPGNGETREFVIWRSDLDADANRDLAALAISAAVEGVPPEGVPAWVKPGWGFPEEEE